MNGVPAGTTSKPAAEAAPGFRQQLTLFDATMLVAGTMIGSGIFVVSAEMARDVGSPGWLMAAWVLTGIMTIMGALSYAELAAMMPYAGGQYVFLREAFSPLWGFLYGWTVFLVIQTGSIAAVAVVFAKYLGVFVPALGGSHILYESAPLPEWLIKLGIFEARDAAGHAIFQVTAAQCVGVVVIMLLAFINCLGVREGKWVQNVFTIAKTAALIGLIVVGLTVAANADAIQRNLHNVWWGRPDTARIDETLTLFGKNAAASPMTYALVVLMVMAATMTNSLFSADAWNNVTFSAAEVQNPTRNLAKSMAYGAGLVIVLYLLAQLAYFAALPMDGHKDGSTPFQRGIAHASEDRVATAVLEEVSPNAGAKLMAAAIMISTFGCVNGMMLMGARLYYAMARDSLFFQSVGRLNGRGVPAAGLILQGIWSVVLTFSGTYNRLLDFVMIAAMVFYVLTVSGLFVLRYTRPEAPRPYKAFGYPIIPGLYVVLCALITVDWLVVKPEFTVPCMIIVLTGIPVYGLWRLNARRAPIAATAP